MKKPYLFRSLILLMLSILLSGCFGPKTPLEVTEAFWRSVVENDVKSVVAYSTLTTPGNYDAFGHDWRGYQPIWGRIIIEGNNASVESQFVKPGRSDEHNKKFITYLIKQDEKWLVDYAKTEKSLRGGPLGEFLEKISELGDEITRQLGASARNMEQEMAQLSEELERYADTFNQQAEERMNEFAQALRNSMEELESSIRRALKEKRERLNNEERRTLTELANELDQQSDKLADPTVQSISQSGKVMAEAQSELYQLESDAINSDKQQWQGWFEQFWKDMKGLVATLAEEKE